MKVLDSDIVYRSISHLTLSAISDTHTQLGGAESVRDRASRTQRMALVSLARLGRIRLSPARGGLHTCEFGHFKREPRSRTRTCMRLLSSESDVDTRHRPARVRIQQLRQTGGRALGATVVRPMIQQQSQTTEIKS